MGYIADLGVSHLYLSPIFTASTGSTHGYDVIDPNQIDPVLGGRPAFERLVEAARNAGLGIILDIVPNHTAFTLENAWLRDVLIAGSQSAYARHFDIDWDAGPLVLPILPAPFEKMLADGGLSVDDGHLVFGDLRVPLRKDIAVTATDPAGLRELHAQQHWRLRHWEAERDWITHRRFFNVTSLVGMRVEDPQVFADTHALLIDLVREGMIDGLRIDHIDGLADPAAYLDRLTQAAPEIPIWVEKILVGDERLPPAWKTVGTTGYEAARLLARSFTSADGMVRLDAAWRDNVGDQGDFASALARSKQDILQHELAAELHQLVALASRATSSSIHAEPGPETLREALVALLSATPRYRTYIDTSGTNPEDRAIIAAMAEQAKTGLRSAAGVNALAAILLDPTTPDAQRLAVRFQQISGALLAKAQEDTAGFRWTRYLAANEVGAEPTEPVISERNAARFLSSRTPWDMNLTSSHDTKRSEDARMRLTAISRAPDAFGRLFRQSATLPAAAPVSARWRWYIVQSCLAIWDRADPHLDDRLAEHIRKAMREAKETTFWTNPDESLEGGAIAFARAVTALWRTDQPAELDTLVVTGDALIFAQLAFKAIMPGFPDFYRGSEAIFLALTDPDNRRDVDWDQLAKLRADESLSARKAELTRRLLQLRRDEAGFLRDAVASMTITEDRTLMTRSDGHRVLVAGIASDQTEADDIIWSARIGSEHVFLGWRRQPSG
tara:strand:+ start:1103 stop:3286 length:2184 start_codon:yes stop_codon:yes gene_type:complete